MARITKSATPDAIALLKADHRTVEALFERFENARGPSAQAKIAQQICLELCVHTAIEEQIFYPAVKGVVEEDIYTEAHVEHDGAKMLIAEILASDPEDEFYEAKVQVLSEEIKHHVKEEERRGGMFAQAKERDIDMKELGQAMFERKAKLIKAYKSDGIPTPETCSMKVVNLNVGAPVSADAA